MWYFHRDWTNPLMESQLDICDQLVKYSFILYLFVSTGLSFIACFQTYKTLSLNSSSVVLTVAYYLCCMQLSVFLLATKEIGAKKQD